MVTNGRPDGLPEVEVRRADRRGFPFLIRAGRQASTATYSSLKEISVPPHDSMSAAQPTFAELGVPAPVAAALAARGITSAFPIQAATLPDTLAGRDVLGRGRTGSGKTVAFAVPTVAALTRSRRARQPKRPRALILVPTRELASQVSEVIRPLAAATGLRTTTVYGGVGQGPQVSALRQGVDVMVACPGRLEDLIARGQCRLDAVEVTVLDEADHMADLGFLPAVKRLLNATPAGGQRMLFSATLDNDVDSLVRRYLVDPVTHSVDPAVAPVSTMTHHVLQVQGSDKAAVVRELASGLGRTLLFTRTKHAARKLAGQLTASGVPAVDLHGNLNQNARERNLAAFSAGRVRVLVATDIAARGIHVDDIGLVVHVDPPADPKAYLHRSGRTGRAGAEGVVVTVMTPEQQRDVRTLARQAGIQPTTDIVTPGAAPVVALSGPKAPLVTPTAAPARATSARSSSRPGRSSSAPRQQSRQQPRQPSGQQSRQQGPRRTTSAAGVSERGPRRPARGRAA